MAWPIFAAAGLGALGGVAGSLLSSASQSRDVMRTNEANQNMSREQRDWSALQSAQQMAFQERMSNSAYQRQVQDLQKAGLNPMLAAMNGGASSPSGAMGSGNAIPSQTNPAAGGVGKAISLGSNSAMNAAFAAQDYQAKDAQIAATRAQGVAALANAGSADASALATRTKMPRYQAESQVAQARSKYDVKSAGYDAVVKRVLDALGGASDAVSLRRLFQGSRPTIKPNRLR